MEIVVNTDYESAGTKVWIDDFCPYLKEHGHSVTRNDWDSYEEYDVAIFTAPDSDVASAVAADGKITTVIMDPKLDLNLDDVRRSDILVVSSIEQKERFLKFDADVIIYPPFPQYNYNEQETDSGHDEVVLGYHGNIFHARQFRKNIRPAINQLGGSHNIRLLAIYDKGTHGKWTYGVPEGVPVEHIQWTPNVYKEKLSTCDIGIVNDFIPIPEKFARLITQYPSLEYITSTNNIFGKIFKKLVTRRYNYNMNDDMIRMKYTTNPGRIYPFAALKIPVVCDYSPSNSQVVTHGSSGYLTKTKTGWKHYLEQLITEPTKRKEMGQNLNRELVEEHSIDRYAKYLIRHLETASESK